MKSCIYCGNTLEDQAQFCNVCGQRQQASQPQYQAPQYQQPYYQAPQHQAPYAPAYAGNANFVPPVNTIGLFNLIGAIVTMILGYITNLIPGIPMGGLLFNLILPFLWSVVYLLITWIGFANYNKTCVMRGYPRKKLGIGWLFLIWGIREVISFVFGFIWGFAYSTMLYSMSYSVIATVSLIWSIVNSVGSALLTWLIGNAILKAVVKNK